MARVDTRLRLKDGQAFVRGRSTANARTLLELAGDRDAEVITVTNGYLAPVEVAEESGLDFITAEDQPAVITQPGTTTNRDEANNVGGRAKVADEAEADENPTGAEFDPSKATVEEVNTYLEGADEAERTRVLEAEAAGKNRKGITEEAK
jgi:hypothetical protein